MIENVSMVQGRHQSKKHQSSKAAAFLRSRMRSVHPQSSFSTAKTWRDTPLRGFFQHSHYAPEESKTFSKRPLNAVSSLILHKRQHDRDKFSNHVGA